MQGPDTCRHEPEKSDCPGKSDSARQQWVPPGAVTTRAQLPLRKPMGMKSARLPTSLEPSEVIPYPETTTAHNSIVGNKEMQKFPGLMGQPPASTTQNEAAQRKIPKPKVKVQKSGSTKKAESTSRPAPALLRRAHASRQNLPMANHAFEDIDITAWPATPRTPMKSTYI